MNLPPPRQFAQDIALSLVFFTRLPLPRLDFGKRTLAQSIWAAPIAGLVVAAIGSLAYVLAASAGLSVGLAAALALTMTMLATGCLHEDGLSDVADGFGGGSTRDRKLEIMRDSRIGAYGASALILSVLLRWTAISDLATPLAVFCGLVAAHVASRALLPAFMHLLPPARSDGLSSGAGIPSSQTAIVAGALGLAALLAIGLAGLIPAIVALGIVFFIFQYLCQRQIGGQTGDTLGALQQIAEITVLTVAAAILS